MEPLDNIKNQIWSNLSQFLLSFKNILDVIQTCSNQTEIVLINLKKKKKISGRLKLIACGQIVEDRKKRIEKYRKETGPG